MLEVTTESKSRVHLRSYIRRSKAIGISWAILTCCFLIINIIVFIQPQWIGDTTYSYGTGWVGLYELCELVDSGTREICQGQFQDFTTILTDAFRASTFFIGVSCLIIFLCILLFLLFLFCDNHAAIYYTLGTLQLISTIFMFLGCVIFPHGWDHFYVKRICGDSTGRYHIGNCEMRWAYILAIIGIFDILILTVLAFVLGCRQADKVVDYEYSHKPLTARSTGNGSYVVDVTNASKAGSMIMPPSKQHEVLVHAPGSTLGGAPVYIVDDADHRSDYSMSRRKHRLISAGNGSDIMLIRDNKSTSSKRHGTSRVRSGSF